MKKHVALILSFALITSSAHAEEQNLLQALGLHPAAISTLGVTLLPSLLVYAAGASSSGGMKNDIIQVQDDAVIALETGVVSVELQSVVNKLRLNLAPEAQSASDLELIAAMYVMEQQ